MMSLGQIRAASREAAVKAAAERLEPFILEDTDLEDIRLRIENGGRSGPMFPFPMIGDHTPAGWERVDQLFVDTSGWGSPGEAALTPAQLLERLQVGKGYALIEIGQFQAYLGVFQRVN